jgi:hypothetical protein
MQRFLAAATSFAALLALVLAVTPTVHEAAATGIAASSVCSATPDVDPDPPVYYSINIVPTGKVSGVRKTDGVGNIMFATSPYGVALSPEGHYVYELDIQMQNARLDDDKVLTAWVTTPNIDKVNAIGPLDENLHVRGRVDYNKFLVVITLEPASEEPGDMWTGPIVARGMSRSGLMHTMAGHGPFQSEPCAVFGYN